MALTDKQLEAFAVNTLNHLCEISNSLRRIAEKLEGKLPEMQWAMHLRDLVTRMHDVEYKVMTAQPRIYIQQPRRKKPSRAKKSTKPGRRP